MRIAIIGKDSVRNKLALADLISLHLEEMESPAFVVGVPSFDLILREKGLPTQLYERPRPTLDDGFAFALARRLAAMMSEADMVIKLPDAGRMTSIEASFAKELKATVWDFLPSGELQPEEA